MLGFSLVRTGRSSHSNSTRHCAWPTWAQLVEPPAGSRIWSRGPSKEAAFFVVFVASWPLLGGVDDGFAAVRCSVTEEETCHVLGQCGQECLRHELWQSFVHCDWVEFAAFLLFTAARHWVSRRRWCLGSGPAIMTITLWRARTR